MAAFKLLQPENALSPIAVVLFGIVIEVRPVHPEKALSAMLVTLSAKVTSFNDFKFANQEPTLGQFSVMEVRDLQPEKASSPMLVTPLGMVIEVNALQS
jgi:hypothetical protein